MRPRGCWAIWILLIFCPLATCSRHILEHPDHAVDHCQSWEGISCDGNGNVRKVLLRQGELHGPLPDEWSGFQYLESIQISHNRLTATLPASWSAISSLKVLQLNNNRLTGTLPPDWSNLQILQKLNLEGNRLQGILPVEYSALQELLIIDLHTNAISGSLPATWSVLPVIEQMNLDNLALTGTLPASWSALSTLNFLLLGRGKLAGPLPSSWASMSSLSKLDLNSQSIGGALPELFSRLITLKELNLRNNNFIGTLPRSWSHLTMLAELNLNRNLLFGALPSEWTSLQFLEELRLAWNLISGTVGAEWLEMKSLRSFDARMNVLGTSAVLDAGVQIPDNWYLMPQGLRRGAPSSPGGGVETGGGGQGGSQGGNSALTDEEKAALTEEEATAEAERLHSLVTSLGSHSGVLDSWTLEQDHCQWSGITCTDDGSRHVLQISLNRQKLAGSLPEAWSGLASLRSLQLKLNYALTGTLPASWSALTALDSLLANDNLLGGTVPAEWSAMSSLTKLHLHNNMLIGPLPESFGNLVSMQIMLLGRNCFTGTLPTQWSGMTALEKLGLQWHLLTGSLPPEMSHLKALTSLDLSGYDITAATSCVPVLKSHSIRVSDNCSSPSAGGGATEEGTPEAVPPMRCVMPGLRGFLPPAWSALSSLSSLEASHNALSGSLPLSWTALLDLAQLALDDNRLSGTLPTDWTALRVLTRLKLNHNANVTGTLPSSWARLSWLQELSLSECQLTGTVPTEWAGMPALEDLSLGGNFLSGQVPTYLSEAPALAFINVSHNLFLLPEEEWVQPGGRFGSQLWVMEPQRVGFGRMLEITNDPTGDGHGVPVSGDSDDATGTLPGTVASEKEQGGGGGPNDSVLYAIFGCVVGVLVITAVTFVEIRRRKRQVIQSSAVAVGYPLIGSNRQGDLCIRRPTLMKKVSLQEKENVVFEELSQPVQDLHEGMAEELRSRPLRLLTADFVRNCVSLPCYEELEAQGTRQPLAFVEVPYSETEQDLHWDRTAVVSWRWGAPKPETLLRGFSPMTDLQLQELRRYLSVKDEVEYVWVDWCCVPQYSSSPMFEIARSKLFYSRAAKMIILPIAKPLPEGNLRVVLAHAVRALSRGVPGQHQKEDEVMAAAVLQDIRRRGLYSDFGYFGRVWTLAERMARHGRGECLQNWVSLESWIAMTVDALWLSSAEEGADDSPGLQFYWGRLFDPQKARATIQTLRLVRQRGSALAADTHSTEVAQLLVEAVRVWQNGSVTEALDVEWLKNYLQNEAGRVYESWHPEDGVWSIYTFFCWHTRESFPAAHQDLCLLAGLDPRLSQLWPVVQAVQTSLSPEPRSPPVRNTPPGKEDMNYLRLPQLDTPQSELHPRRTVRGRLSNMFRSRRIDDPPSEASSSYSRPPTAMRVRRTTGGGLHPNNSSLSDVVPRELEFQEEPSDQEAAQQGAAISSGTRRVSTPTSPFSTQLQLLQAEEEADCETPTRAEICCALPGTVSSAASPPQAPTKSRSKKQRWSFV